MLRHLRAAVRWPFSRLFRDDIFISYRRSDGLELALALAEALVEKSYATFVDLYDTESSAEIPDRVLRRLRAARLLVVVVTRDAGASRWMADEVRAFRRTGRNVVAVDVDGALEALPWKDEFIGLPLLVHEHGGQGKGAGAAIVAAVVGAFRYVTRAEWLRRAAWGTTAVVLAAAVTAGALWLAALRSEERRSVAEERASAIRIANVANDAFRRHSLPVDTVLLLAAESLRRDVAGGALQTIEAALRVRIPPPRVLPLSYDAEQLILSPDGRRAVVADLEKFSIIELATLTPLHVEGLPPLHHVGGMAISRDGTTFVVDAELGESGTGDAVLVLDLRHEPSILRRHDHTLVYSVAISRRGDIYLIENGRDDGLTEVTAYSTITGQQLWEKVDATNPVFGNGVVVVSAEDRLVVLDERSGHELDAVHVQQGVESISVSAQGNHFVVLGGTGEAGNFEVFEVSAGGRVESRGRREVGSDVESAVLSPDGSRVVTVSSSAAKFWDGESWFPGSELAVTTDSGPEFFADSRFAMVPTLTAIRIIDTRHSWVDHDAATLVAEPVAARVTRSGDVVAIAGRKGKQQLQVWRVGMPGGVVIAGFFEELDPAGKYAVSLVGSGQMRVVDTGRGATVFEKKVGGGIIDVGPVAASEDARVVAAGLPFRVRTFDRAGNSALPERQPRGDRVIRAIAMSRSGRWLVTGSSRGVGSPGGRLRLGETATGRITDSIDFATPIIAVAVSEDGRIVTYVHEDGRMCLRDTQRKTARCVTKEGVTAVAISPDGAVAAGGGTDRVLHLVTVASGVRRSVRTEGLIEHIAFNARGDRVALAGPRGGGARSLTNVTVAGTASGKIVTSMLVEYGIRSIAFGDARHLRVIDDGGSVRTIAVDPAVTPREICTIVGRGLDRAEWQRLFGNSERYGNPCETGN